jgi:exonuclease SbcC
MLLLKLEVKNWVHHRQRTCEFTRGLVGILGENGSGKSSLFGAVRWLLTGENPNYGVKTDNISQYAKEGEPSYARLTFEHSGHTAVVTRHLLPDKEPATLLIDGKEVARGEKGVTAEIEKLLGVDAKFISRFIIVGQTDIFSFIDDNQADTDKFFQRLFNTSKADKCQDVIGKVLLKATPPEILKPSSQLLIEQGELQAQIDALDEQIAELPTLDAFLRTQEVDQATIQQWDRREQAGVELQALNQQAEQSSKDIERYTGNLAEYEKDVAAFKDAISGKAESHREAKIALGHWANYKNIATLKEKLQAQRADIEKQRREFPEPPEPTGQSFVQMRAEIDQATRDIADAERFVTMFTESGVAECPTCHTPSTQLGQQVEEQRRHIKSLRDTLDNLTIAATEQAAAEHKRREWAAMDNKLRALENQLDESERNLTFVRPPAATEEELQQAVADFEDFDGAQKELEPVIQHTREQIAKLNGSLAAVNERRQQLSELIKESKVTQADAHMAKTRLAAMREQCTQRQKLEQQKSQLVFDFQRLVEQYEIVVKQETEAVKLRKWAAIADTAREALKNAPRLVAQRNLQRLETAINELLQIFSVNFQVKVAGDGSPAFIAEFYDGRRQVAQRLSIGQKTVLALAFRVAVNAMFAEEIGLLALDEPTASLDQPRIQALAPVLEKLRDLSTAKGLQCLLVTHASSLSHLFESTIELEPPELRNARAAG